ncbi:hypothetical protein B0A68_08285 [Flavobacterium reichenbachii]|uniref:Uncharacterized protein n=1 Tax=Flavobacterium reichenbachii TaxID=362418 RepID=A0A085ZKW9_9FLAO|nr:hypothetical protein IW19_05870 [Flavobacterium reichenbachii]OXB16245.1 hypothetical protein B0A68_08285 [Flavobacterium reichenbachii]
MYQIIFILLFTLPLIFQILFGWKSINDRIKLSFTTVCSISLFSQFIFSFTALKLLSYKMRSGANGEIHCGMPLLGLIFFEIFIAIIILLIILIQYLIRRHYNRKKLNK